VTAGAVRIAVIEDDAEVRELVTRMLRSGGYEAVAPDDPLQAVAFIRRESPSLVLCDVAMPGLDGYAVIEQLRADPETARCPVVFLSGHREFSDRVKAFKAGAVDFIAKPFTRESLLGKVERILTALKRHASIEEIASQAEAERKDPVRVVAPGSAAGIERDPPALEAGTGNLPAFGALPAHLRTVLIAEDNTTFRAYLRGLLTTHGFTVYEASEGQGALRIALEKRPWLILADVSMPGQGGFELCRRVRGHSLISHTPIVFLSGWDDYRDRQRGLQLGADEFLSKQTTARELLIRINLLLQRFSEAGGKGSRRAMEGSIDFIGAPGMLQMWNQSQLSGVCTARSGSAVFEARFHEGDIVAAALGSKQGVEAVYSFLAWHQGTFRFVPGEVAERTPISESFDQLLLEGCRLLDEERRTPGE
jgi:DNA-binding response OmpR family regulator